MMTLMHRVSTISHYLTKFFAPKSFAKASSVTYNKYICVTVCWQNFLVNREDVFAYKTFYIIYLSFCVI